MHTLLDFKAHSCESVTGVTSTHASKKCNVYAAHASKMHVVHQAKPKGTWGAIAGSVTFILSPPRCAGDGKRCKGGAQQSVTLLCCASAKPKSTWVASSEA